MFDKVRELFSVTNDASLDIVTKERRKRCIKSKSLTAEETLLLASGMDLLTIRSRKTNLIFVKMSYSMTQQGKLISKKHVNEPGLQILKQQDPESEK